LPIACITRNGVPSPASEAILRRSARSIPMFRADFLPFASKMGLAQIRWKTSTTGRRKTRDWLVERSVARLFHRKWARPVFEVKRRNSARNMGIDRLS
jgi:hypothetical protein